MRRSCGSLSARTNAQTDAAVVDLEAASARGNIIRRLKRKLARV